MNDQTKPEADQEMKDVRNLRGANSSFVQYDDAGLFVQPTELAQGDFGYSMDLPPAPIAQDFLETLKRLERQFRYTPTVYPVTSAKKGYYHVVPVSDGCLYWDKHFINFSPEKAGTYGFLDHYGQRLEYDFNDDGAVTEVRVWKSVKRPFSLLDKHNDNHHLWMNHVKNIPNPKQGLYEIADLAVAQKHWAEHLAHIDFDDAGTAGWTDPEGNDWEFDHDGAHNLIAARVMYEDDGMEGGDLDIDLLDQLSEAEQAEADALWAQVQWGADQPAGTMTLEGASGKNYLVTHDGKGNVLHVRRDTGRPAIDLEEQPAITQSQLYRDTLATGHQDAQAQIVRNEIGLAIQILRNVLVELRNDVTEVAATAGGSVTAGEILNTYFHELLEYKGQLDAGKNTTEDQDRRAFFVMAIIAFYKTQRDFMKNPTQNQLPAHMRQLRRR